MFTPNEEYGSIQWDSTILSVEGDIDRGVKELRRIAMRLAWNLRFGWQSEGLPWLWRLWVMGVTTNSRDFQHKIRWGRRCDECDDCHTF